MDFRTLTVKEVVNDPKLIGVIEEHVPEIKKFPIKLYNRRTLGEVLDMIVKQKIVSASLVKKIGEELNVILAKEGK